MEIYKKLAAARDFIKASPVKKAGKNKFSDYDYFTPEQINSMVHAAEVETGLIHLFSMKRNADGLHGYLFILNVDDDKEYIELTQATDIPLIKATNVAQQIGGAVTYTLRYMLMTAFDIADNSLDYDAKDNREEKVQPTVEQKTISANAFKQLCDKLKANPDPTDRGNLLAKTRRYYLPLTEEQERIIFEITDNI